MHISKDGYKSEIHTVSISIVGLSAPKKRDQTEMAKHKFEEVKNFDVVKGMGMASVQCPDFSFTSI